jgi:hypothetical protein
LNGLLVFLYKPEPPQDVPESEIECLEPEPNEHEVEGGNGDAHHQPGRVRDGRLGETALLPNAEGNN